MVPSWLDKANSMVGGVHGALNGWYSLDGSQNQTRSQITARQFPEQAAPTPLSNPIVAKPTAPPLLSTQNMMLFAGAVVLLVVLVKK